MDLREQIGQRLVTGFPGTELTEDFRRMVREYKISNVILFRENITDCAQLKQLCGEIQALVRRETGHGAFITADQEGGLVTRLPGDAVNVPGAMAIAATGDPENAYRAGLLTGRELRALGVNFDLAPSVDVNSNPENPVIGARSYGDTPQEVSRYANRMIRGLLDGGVLCSAKHFPGHGDTDTDSHLALPCVDKSMEELERTELLPFREAVRAGVPAVMTTHILFPQLEPEHLPATMSRRIMTGVLREQMGFDGLIVSDCMEMRAIKDHFGTVNGVVAAMAAGVDLVFISHDTLLSGQAARAAEQAVAEGRLSAAEMQASVQRILALKEKWVDGMPEGGFDFDAARRENEALLQKLIAMDDGAAYLGECALVPYDSPINQTGILFYNTLFDENACCHLALGMGFIDTIRDYPNRSLEEMRALGVNDSMIHEDFMIGTPDLAITAHCRDGRSVPVFRDGTWAF